MCCHGPVQVFSCCLGSEQETALSIIDPVNVQVELCGSPTYQSSTGLLDAFNIEDFPPLLEVGVDLSPSLLGLVLPGLGSDVFSFLCFFFFLSFSVAHTSLVP